MMRASLELGAKHGVKAARAFCTGPASAAASRKAGMQEVYKLPYDKYKANGEVVFKKTPYRVSHLTVLTSRLQKYPPYSIPIYTESKIMTYMI